MNLFKKNLIILILFRNIVAPNQTYCKLLLLQYPNIFTKFIQIITTYFYTQKLQI